MTGQRVLVLRPEPGASETAGRLRERGFVPIVMPLSEIRPMPSRLPVDLTNIACVAATSVNAMRHAPASLLEEAAGLPLFAVGEATAQAARAAGFQMVVAGSDDGAALAKLILNSQPAGAVLYLCGKVRRPEFENILLECGQAVLPVEVYDAVPIGRAAEFARLVSEAVPLVAMCHSPEAARMLAGLIADTPGATSRIRAVAISARAAQSLIATGVAVEVAPAPTEQAMLAMLK